MASLNLVGILGKQTERFFLVFSVSSDKCCTIGVEKAHADSVVRGLPDAQHIKIIVGSVGLDSFPL